MSGTTVDQESVGEPAGAVVPEAWADERLIAMVVDRAHSEEL